MRTWKFKKRQLSSGPSYRLTYVFPQRLPRQCGAFMENQALLHNFMF